MYKGETACRRKIIYVLLVNDTLLVNESPPTTENGVLYQSIVGNTYKNSGFRAGVFYMQKLGKNCTKICFNKFNVSIYGIMTIY